MRMHKVVLLVTNNNKWLTRSFGFSKIDFSKVYLFFSNSAFAREVTPNSSGNPKLWQNLVLLAFRQAKFQNFVMTVIHTLSSYLST